MTVTASSAVPRTEVVGRAILIVAALATATVAGISIGQLSSATPQTVIGETTSALSLAVFAGLFALLAWRPVSYPGVLELCFALKLGIALIAIGQREADGAWLAIIFNGLVALALLVAYVLLRCYRAWHRQSFVRESTRTKDARERGATTGRAGGSGAPGRKGRRDVDSGKPSGTTPAPGAQGARTQQGSGASSAPGSSATPSGTRSGTPDASAGPPAGSAPPRR